MKKIYLVLMLILVIGAGLRFTGSDRSFFNDEVVWVSTIENLFATGEPVQYVQCNEEKYFYWHPPFWILAYSTSVAAFGFTEFAFRLVPILFGLATIVVTYFLGKELYSYKTGILAALLMSISHYHILYSQNVDIDGGILAFFNTSAVLFFVMYKKRNTNKYLYISLAFIMLALFSKFSGFVPIFAMMAYSYFHDKRYVKKDAAILIITSIAALIPLLLYSLIVNDINTFTGPIEYILHIIFDRAGDPTLNQILFSRAFYLTTVTWMLTPFATALFGLALYRLKKDKNYFLLIVWALLTYIGFSISVNLDIQRYTAAVLAPVFIMIAHLIITRMKFTRTALYTIVAAALVAAAGALMFNINDLQGYHNPVIIGSVYVIAGLLIIAPIKKYKIPILFGAFAGLTLYLFLSGGTWHVIQSNTVDILTQNAIDFDFDYRDVWGNKDIEYYLSPENKTMNYCFPQLNEDFLKKNGVRYISAYSFRDEDSLIKVSDLCAQKKEVIFNGHLIGLTCVLRSDRI